MSKQLEIINKNEATILEQIDREKVKSQIYEVRGLRVMLDSDIAAYFGVTTGNLNKAKNRNIERFPENFCFTLSDHEISLFQFGIPMQTKGIKGGRSNNPTVYTEHGIAMLTSVLHTPRAVAASIQIINVFVEVAHYILQNKQLLPYEELKLLQNRQEKLYHCGASSKDAGRKITTITEIKGLADYKNTLKSLLLNRELNLN